jgi:peptide/nickel transport system permease protein
LTGVRRFVLRRVAGIVAALALVSLFTFLMTFAIPHDPARAIVGPRGTDEQLVFIRNQLGLDDPLVVQYGRYMGHLAQLDLGYSYTNRRPVLEILVERLPRTALLALAAMVVQFAIGIPVGLLAAARAGGVTDRLSLALSLLIISLPSFWLGLVLIYLLAYRWPVFPLGGADSPQAIVLPALTLGLAGAAWYVRVMRASATEFLHSDFVQALRAKGVPRRALLFKHVLRAALGPMLTMVAIDFGLFLSGAVVVESVFGWPGLGLAAFQAISTGDAPLLMGCVLVGSFFVLLLNAAADALRAFVDPRVRLE